MKTACMMTMMLGISLVAMAKKPVGEIPDPSALAGVRTFCVDFSNLSASQASEVRRFLKTESKPKKLLSDFPWTLGPDCEQSHPDAIVKLDFPLLNTMGAEVGQTIEGKQSDAELLKTKASLEVSDATSGKRMYQVLVSPPSSAKAELTGDNPVVQRRDAMYNAFRTLLQDLHSLPPVSP